MQEHLSLNPTKRFTRSLSIGPRVCNPQGLSSMVWSPEQKQLCFIAIRLLMPQNPAATPSLAAPECPPLVVSRTPAEKGPYSSALRKALGSGWSALTGSNQSCWPGPRANEAGCGLLRDGTGSRLLQESPASITAQNTQGISVNTRCRLGL